MRPRLTDEQPDFQFHLVADDDAILARARSIPVGWDGTIEDLPPAPLPSSATSAVSR